MLLPYLRKRSEIIEIVGARDIIFALSQSGVCAAFSRGTPVFIMIVHVSNNHSELPFVSSDKPADLLSEWKSR